MTPWQGRLSALGLIFSIFFVCYSVAKPPEEVRVVDGDIALAADVCGDWLRIESMTVLVDQTIKVSCIDDQQRYLIKKQPVSSRLINFLRQADAQPAPQHTPQP